MTSGPRALLRRPRVNRWALLVVPGALFLCAFLVYPLVAIGLKSLNDPSPATYRILTSSPIYLRSLETTFETAGLITVTCLVLGYPYAYLMVHVRPRYELLLLALMVIPFFTSFLVRTFSIQLWLQDTGVVNSVLQSLGIIDHPLGLIRNRLAVTIGMTQNLLPVMVLPLYTVARRIDQELVHAASSLGAPPFTAFRKVFLPLSVPGIYAGSLLVFVLSLGFYIAPAILGGTSNVMISTLIADQVNQEFQFGQAAALGMVLLGATLVVLAVGSRLTRLGPDVGDLEDA